MMAVGDQEKAKETQAQIVHTFENLTITDYNSTLSNKPFTEKHDIKDSEGNYIGYRNGLNLNSDVVSQDTWTASKIANRTDMLVSKVLQMLKL